MLAIYPALHRLSSSVSVLSLITLYHCQGWKVPASSRLRIGAGNKQG